MDESHPDGMDVLAAIGSATRDDLPTLLSSIGRQAAAGDHTAALMAWSRLGRLFPAADFLAASARLVARQDYPEADRLLSHARSLFPDDIQIAIEYARLPQHAGDHERAARRFGRLRADNPNAAVAFLEQARSLLHAGQGDAAIDILADAIQRFPTDQGIAALHAEATGRMGHLEEALSLWDAIRTSFPGWTPGYLNAAKLLRGANRFAEADALLRQAVDRFAPDFTCLSEYAWLAQLWGNLQDASARWATVRHAHPDQEVGYIQGARAAASQALHEEAEAILHAARERFPHAMPIAAEWADLPTRRGAPQIAADRWAIVRAQFPHDPCGTVEGIRLLRALGRLDEAERLAATGTEAFPGNAAVQDEGIRLRPDRLAQTRTVLTARVQTGAASADEYIRLMETLLDLEQYPDLPALAAEARQRFPDNVEVLVLDATCIEKSGDLASADQLWQALQDRFPHDSRPLRRRRDLLVQLGQPETAETLSQLACERFPRDHFVCREHAELAEQRQDWIEAHRRWTVVGQRFNEDVGQRLHDMRIKMLDQEIELAQQGGANLAPLLNASASRPVDAEADERRTVMMTFESLGGIVTGCEFGAVQRAFGAEPLGLLRWSGMAMHTLIDLLERRLENVGQPSTTQVGYYDQPGRREYSVKDLTFGFTLHTHIYEDQMTEQAVFDQVTRRMRFLTRKMLDDLTRRDKIFLFKNTLREPDAAEIERLDKAMRAYGDNQLLIVASASAASPNATLRELTGNIWLGYVDFSGEYGPDRAERWLDLCRRAHRTFHAEPAVTMAAG